MSRKNRPIGTCHICGVNCKLSYEHIPPQSAFNDRKVIKLSGKELIGLDPDDYCPKGQIQQGGAGDYTLCSGCNNKTGDWYGRDFVDWCYQGKEYLLKTKGKPTLYYMYYLFPLRIIKEIVTMFFSVNTPDFQQENPDLVGFVLNKERKYLPPKYRIYVYYNISNRYRYVGVSTRLNIVSSKHCVFSEINFPPFGYVLTLDSGPPDDRLCEISYFSRYYDYGEFKVMNLRMPVLSTCSAYPGDYRAKAEIIKGAKGLP
jgi:hypothetical protein